MNLVVQYEAFIDENWRAIVRYDCAHGFFHRDLLKPNGEQEKKVFEIPDLNTAFSFARQDLEDRWKWYKEDEEMTNKESVKKDLAVGMDFIKSLIQSPDLIDHIPDGSTVSFLDEAGCKIESTSDQKMQRKYVRVRRSFELL